MLESKRVHIVLSSSDQFIEHCATTMASILYHVDKEYEVRFYILSYDITNKNKKKLADLTKIKPCTIEYPRFDELLLDMFEGIHLPSHVTKMTYARVLIPDILPDVDKAIFIDSDTIVRSDITELYKIDLSEHHFAMVEDANWKIISWHLWDGACEYYFNCGVILVNARKLRQDNYIERIKDKIAQNGHRYKICDQDVLNDTFRGSILRLNVTWNCYHEIFVTKYKKYAPDNLEEFFQTCNNPSVVHFVGPEKPWLASINHKFKKDYYFYNKLTSFYRYFEFQNYTLADIFQEKSSALTLFGKTVYLKINKKGKKYFYLFGQLLRAPNRNFIQLLGRIFTRREATNTSYKLSVLGCTIVSKKNTRKKKYLKLFGIPVFRCQDGRKSFCWVNFRYFAKLIGSIKWRRYNRLAFKEYEGQFAGREVVVVGGGPTVNLYEPLPGAIHVGINGAFQCEKIDFDFLFMQDYSGLSYLNRLAESKFAGIKKFFGILIPPAGEEYEFVNKCIIPKDIIKKYKAKRFYIDCIVPWGAGRFTRNLSFRILNDMGSTSFTALQFVLYTRPKRIYLVGMDCSAGHFFDSKSNANATVPTWSKFKNFVEKAYPSVEIVSINPVGLKGLFTDEYQESSPSLV